MDVPCRVPEAHTMSADSVKVPLHLHQRACRARDLFVVAFSFQEQLDVGHISLPVNLCICIVRLSGHSSVTVEY